MNQPPTTHTPLPSAFLDVLSSTANIPSTGTANAPITSQSYQNTLLGHTGVPENATVSTSTAMINPHQIQKAKMQNVPAFLNKLYNMVEDPASDELIRWAADGSSFIVARHEDLAKKVLPRFFKHSNFSSFVRQLNMYGFHKVPHLQQGVLQTDGKAEQWEFSNPHFQRNQPDLLLLVTRKKGRDADEKEHGHYDLSHVLDEISTIKKHQMSISSHLKTIQSDNQVLWRENIVARERHQRHQETIDKILRFLASVFSNEKERPTIPRKRRYLIANTSTDDSKRDGQEPSPAKVRCSSPKQKSTGYTLEERGETEQTRSSASSQARSSASPKTRSDGLSTLTRPSESLVADLAEAIALNDQTKQQLSTQGNLPLQSSVDFSTLFNAQQLQGLQSLFNLAQINPTLFNQLTSSAFSNSSLTPNSNYNSIAEAAAAATTIPSPEIPISVSAPVSPSIETNAKPSLYTNTNTSHSSSPSLSEIHHILPVNSLLAGYNTPFHIEDASNDIRETVDTIQNDMDALGSSIDALASHLGIDSSRFSQETEMDYVNMDDFLNDYSQPASELTPPNVQDQEGSVTMNEPQTQYP